MEEDGGSSSGKPHACSFRQIGGGGATGALHLSVEARAEGKTRLAARKFVLLAPASIRQLEREEEAVRPCPRRSRHRPHPAGAPLCSL